MATATIVQSHRVGRTTIGPTTVRSLKRSANKPAATVSCQHIDLPEYQHLACVPTAFYNAGLIVGHPLSAPLLHTVKLQDNPNQAKRGANIHRYANQLLKHCPNLDMRNCFIEGGNGSATLNQICDHLLTEGYATAVVGTKTPAHAFVVHLESDGSLQLVDNGAFTGIERWRGANIDTMTMLRHKDDIPQAVVPARSVARVATPPANGPHQPTQVALF